MKTRGKGLVIKKVGEALMITDHHMPIGILAAYACFSRDEQSELFGFWYFHEMGLPSTWEEKRRFFHDLMTGRCCQLRLKGSLEQILELIQLSGQSEGKMPAYSSLIDAVEQYGSIRVTFDDLEKAEGTSLELNMLVRLTETKDAVVAKVKSRRDVVELEIEPGWSILSDILEFQEEDPRTNIDDNDSGLIDEEIYNQAKPHLQDAYVKFLEAGKGIREYFAFLLEQFGPDIKPYVMRFMEELKNGSTFHAEAEIQAEDLTNDDLPCQYMLNSRDKRLVTSAITFLTNLVQSGRLSPAQLISAAKILHAYSRIPVVTDGLDIQVSVTTPRRWFGDIETYYWWDVKVQDETLTVSGGGHFYRDSTGGDTFSVLQWNAYPGKTEYVDYLCDLPMVPDIRSFEDAVKGFDFSDESYGVSIEDPDNKWLYECDEG